MRAAVLACLFAAPAAAHPHVWVDGAVGFALEDGRLAAITVEWRFEPFYTLLILEELGLDPDAEPDAAALEKLAGLQPGWAADFGGEGALSVGGAPRALGPAEGVTARLADGALAISFRRPLVEPVDPRGVEVTASVYDPLFFVAYTLVGRPAVEGGEGCTAEVNPFNPLGEATEMLSALSLLGPDERPEDPGVGAMFADRAALRCG